MCDALESQMRAVDSLEGISYFNPGIPGIEYVLEQDQLASGEAKPPRTTPEKKAPENASSASLGFSYPSRDGLTVVIHGPPGSGKTMLALQMAVGAAVLNAKNVIYLSKDTSAATLRDRMLGKFHLFGHLKLNRFKAERQARTGSRRILVPCTQVATRASLVRTPEETGSQGMGAKQEGPTIALVVLEDLLDEIRREADPATKDISGDRRPGSAPDPTSAESKGGQTAPVGSPPLEMRQMRSTCAKYLNRKVDGSPCDAVLAVGGLGFFTAPTARFDKYALTTSLFAGLARLQPRLAPIFEWLRDPGPDEVPHDKEWDSDLVVVCDSLPTAMLEEYLRVQTEANGAMKGKEDESSGRQPIVIFVMESGEIPAAMTAAFPPDIQIALRPREEAHRVPTKTLQVIKARFQRIRSEQFPFAINDASAPPVVRCEDLVVEPDSRPGQPLAPPRTEREFLYRRNPGITIFPSLATLTRASRQQPEDSGRRFDFGVEGLNNLTREKHLAGGGCTLVITENRCHSGALGLHFLLGEIASAVKTERGKGNQGARPDERKPPRSVLYLAFDNDVEGILNNVLRFSHLRGALADDQGSPQGAKCFVRGHLS
jgi:hypothetical protein